VSEETRDANVRLTADVQPYRQDVAAAADDTTKLAAAVDVLASKLDGLGKRTGKKLTLFAAADLAMMGGMVAVTANYEKQLGTLSGQAAVTGKNIGALSTSIRQASRDMPVARDEVVALTTAISKMGVTSQKDLASFTTTFLKASAATGDSAQGLASSMTSLSRQMGTLGGGGSQMRAFTDSLVKVSATAGVSAQSVADFANSIAPFARVAGIGQKQVLGLSSAFVQAGNDGFAAANTFNTMLADIVRQTSSGGPGLAKYASLVGVTVDEFKKLDSSQQVVKIFKAINDAGPQAVQVLDQMGFDGIRAAKAIQTMAAQSGGLEKLVNAAVGGYGDDSTNKGAEAAMSGFADEMIRAGNIAKDMATSIGSGIITPLTYGLGVLNNITAEASKLTGIFAAGGALAAAGGLASGAAGGIMQVASMAAVPAGIRWLYNSSPLGAFREGRRAAAAAKNGMSIPDGPYIDRYTGGRAGRLEGMGFASGAAVGDIWGGNNGGRGIVQKASSALGFLPRMVAVGANFQSEFYDESRQQGYQRGNQTSLWSGIRAAASSTDSFTRSTLKATAALAKFEWSAAKAGVSAGGAVAGRALGKLGGAAMDFLGGPIGIAAMAGIAAIQVKSMNDEQLTALRDRAKDPNAYNQASPYAAALGTASSSLSDMTLMVGKSSKELDSLAAAAANARNGIIAGGATNPNTASITNKDQAVSYLRSLGANSSPETMNLAFADVRRALPGQAGKDAIDAYMRNPTSTVTLGDISNAAGNIGNSDVSGIGERLGFTLSGDADRKTQMGLGAALQYVSQYSKFGDANVQEQAKVNAAVTMLDAALKGGTANDDPATRKARVAAVAQVEQLLGVDFKYNAANGYGSAAELLGAQDADSTFGNYRTNNPNLVFSGGQAGQTALYRLAVTNTDPGVLGLRGRGVDLQSGYLGDAVTRIGDSTVQNKAVLELYKMAKEKGGGSIAKADSVLQGILAEESTKPGAKFEQIAALAKQAQGLLGVDQQFASVGLGRVGRLQAAQEKYTTVMGEPATDESIPRQEAAKRALESEKANYQQYLMSMVQAQKNFAISMERSDEDYYRTRSQSQEDFQTSMARSTEDFNKSMARAQEDFTQAQKRQGEDAAKSIYNPFRRVQASYTADVGTLKQNLKDQTGRIKKQIANLRKLKRLGLSQQAIDMLDLANPANAQQVEELAAEMSRNDARQINGMVGARQSATLGLTQSDLSQQYRRANEDFRKQMNRASSDFSTSISRATADFNKGLGRMAAAHALQTKRAKEDLDRMSEEQAASFGVLFDKAVTLVTKNIGKAGNATIEELKRVKAAFPELFGEVAKVGDTSRVIYGSNTPRTPSSSTGGGANAYQQNNVNIGSVAVAASDPVDFTQRMADQRRLQRLKGSG